MFVNFLNRNRDIGILLIRIAVGLAFIFVYGKMKMFGGPDLWGKIGANMSIIGITFAPVFWGFLNACAEFIGGIFFTLGLFTRFTSFIMAFNMFVAAMTHFSAHDPWSKPIVPIQLLSVFIAMIFFGGGNYSLDYLIFKKREKASPESS